jgi:multimeric flavodoxin WrbA
VATLLVVHHTPSPSLDSMLEAVLSGARDPSIEGVEVVVRPALGAVTPDVLAADAYVLGTPANLGYMSGALKHFFDQIYYPCLRATAGRPYGVYVHGNNDTEGALAAIQRIVTGLQWRQVTKPVQVTGEPDRAALDRCWELGATVAASLTLDAR